MSDLPIKRKLKGYEYTPLEEAQKEVALREMANAFPNVPIMWREWVYDYIYKEVGEHEFSKRVDCGFYEKKNVSVK